MPLEAQVLVSVWLGFEEQIKSKQELMYIIIFSEAKMSLSHVDLLF